MKTKLDKALKLILILTAASIIRCSFIVLFFTYMHAKFMFC